MTDKKNGKSKEITETVIAVVLAGITSILGNAILSLWPSMIAFLWVIIYWILDKPYQDILPVCFYVFISFFSIAFLVRIVKDFIRLGREARLDIKEILEENE